MSVLHSEPGLEVTCVATREPRISILRLDISALPDDSTAAMTACASASNRLSACSRGVS